MDLRSLAKQSREPKFLVQCSMGMVIVALIISGIIQAVHGDGLSRRAERLTKDFVLFEMGADLDQDFDAEGLAAVIRNRGRAFADQPAKDFRELVFLDAEDAVDVSLEYGLLKSRIAITTKVNEGERERLYLLLDALHKRGWSRASAIAMLEAIPASKRYRNAFLGDAYIAAGQPEQAIAAYIKEGDNYPEAAIYSQRSAVIARMERKEVEALREVLRNPGFSKALSARERHRAHTITKDHLSVLRSTLEMEWQQFCRVEAIMAFFAGLIWFCILVMISNLKKLEIVWSLASVVLGLLFSTVFTLFFIYVQEDLRHFTYNYPDTVLNQMLYMVAGIGLREELAKLICYIPIAIAICRYRNPMLALITAAMCGLGFAISENISYFVREADGFTAWGRFLSANALHFCLTGIVGYSFHQLLVNRGRGWENFLIDFLLVVFAHGIYDGLIIIPQLGEYNKLAFLVLVLMVFRYLDLVRDHLEMVGMQRRVSPLGVFVLGSALLASGIMVISTIELNFIKALGHFCRAVGNSIILSFAFISRLRDL